MIRNMLDKLWNAIGIAGSVVIALTITGIWLMFLVHMWQVARVEGWP
jgi:hypothetical protein